MLEGTRSGIGALWTCLGNVGVVSLEGWWLVVSRRWSRGAVAGSIAGMLRAIRIVKDKLGGKQWARAHSIESQLATLAGMKTALKRGKKKGGTRKKKKPKAE